MERLIIMLVALVAMGVVWLGWGGVKFWIRRSIRVEQEIQIDDRPTLIYFSSPDCVPCRLQQSPILATLRQTLGDCVHFEEYDAVASPDLSRRYRVLTVPTTVVIAPGGEVVAVNYGVAQAEALQHQLEEAVAERKDLLAPC